MALEKRYPEDVAAAPFQIDTPSETRRRLTAANASSVDNKVVVGVPAEALGNDTSVQVHDALQNPSLSHRTCDPHMLSRSHARSACPDIPLTELTPP